MHTPCAMHTAHLHRYACAHGYTLLYYRLAQEGCEHPLWGARHPSYCKLAAIAAALTHGGSGHPHRSSGLPHYSRPIRRRPSLPTTHGL